MDWFERWLTKETAKPDSQGLIDEVMRVFQERESNQYGELTTTWRCAANNLKREWFRVSIGWTDEKGTDKETIFLSEAKGIGNIANIGPIVPVTHWLGSLHARLREASLKGNYPQKLAYGPPGQEVDLPVGPLVEYRIENSQIREIMFFSADAPTGAAAEPGRVPEPATARSSLRPIWLIIDPVQDKNFRWPFHGIYVLSGGPGTGKTSVALLRIRFLIEQQRQKGMEALLPKDMNKLKEDFFTEQDMLVVVWEPHLKTYLLNSLQESRFGDVQVQFYDDWLNERLHYFHVLGNYRIEPGTTELEEVKRRFTEKQLGDWISSWDDQAQGFHHLFSAKAYESILQFIEGVRKAHQLVGTPERAAETWEVFQTPFDRTKFRYSLSGIDTAIGKVNEEIDTLANKCARPEPVRKTAPNNPPARQGKPPETPDERHRRRNGLIAAIPALQERLKQLHEELNGAVQNCYPQMLLKFYEWETNRWVCDYRCSAKDRDEFIQNVGVRIRLKKLSRKDKVLILWLIQLLAERARKNKTEPEESLPDYSHIMVDEAQQYDPLVLRLFCRLARQPFNSVSLVGDLRQRLRDDGGVVVWEDLGLEIPEERRARLLVNYRWAEATFRALHQLVRVLDLPDVELKEPIQWPAGAGLPAAYQVLAKPDAELEWVVDRIVYLRSVPIRQRWSIAVLLPVEYASRHKFLISLLDEVGINTSWTEGKSVIAGRDGVTLTNAESVVGLEFDAVFIAGAHHHLPFQANEVQRQRFWVMATRARQHLCVTSCEPSPPGLAQWLPKT